MTDDLQWRQLDSAEAVAQYAAQEILHRAQDAIARRGHFKLVLAGGTTPKRIYELLAEQQQPWAKWLLFMGDERCLEKNVPLRNSVMIRHSWLDKVHFPKANFYSIAAELGPEQGAVEYAHAIRSFLPFDLTLLGIGEDGHTASLFPGHVHNENELTHAVFDAPKPPPERISLSKKSLANSDKVIILVTGSGKRAAVQQWQQGVDLPVAQIRAIHGVEVLIDSDALP